MRTPSTSYSMSSMCTFTPVMDQSTTSKMISIIGDSLDQRLERCLRAIPLSSVVRQHHLASRRVGDDSAPCDEVSLHAVLHVHDDARVVPDVGEPHRGPGVPVMKKRSSITSIQISIRRASPECRPVVVMSIVGSFETAACTWSIIGPRYAPVRLTRWSPHVWARSSRSPWPGSRSRSRTTGARDDEVERLRPRARLHRTDVPPETTPTIADPSSTVDITGLSPIDRPGHDDDHGGVDTRLDGPRRQRAVARQVGRLLRPPCSASAPAARRVRSRPTIARGRQRQCRHIHVRGRYAVRRLGGRAGSPRTRAPCCCRWRQ